MDDGRDDRGAMPAIAAVDILHHLLAPRMLEIDVDVGRLQPLLRQEALEQQIDLGRIDRGDAEHVADGRIRRRSPALAQDLLAARIMHDVVHGQEIMRVVAARRSARVPCSRWRAGCRRSHCGNMSATPAQVRSSRCCCAVLPGGTGSSGYWYLSWSSEKLMRSAKRRVSAIASGTSRNSRAISSARLQMTLGIGLQPPADGRSWSSREYRSARPATDGARDGDRAPHWWRSAAHRPPVPVAAAAPAAACRRRDTASSRPARRHRRGLSLQSFQDFCRGRRLESMRHASAPEAGLRQIPGDRRTSDGTRPSRASVVPCLPRLSSWHSRP